MATKSVTRRHLTPPQVAEEFGVATAKVITWIRTGELTALNLANRGCRRPRYAIPLDALDDFRRSRQVVPDGGLSTTRRLRRKAEANVREYV